MRALRTFAHAILLGGALLLTTGIAAADGLLIGPSALSPEASTKLESQILAERSANPKAFEAVKNVKGHRPEVYSQFRNPKPMVLRELRGLGAAALLPMLEALAVQAPARGNATDAEWDALKLGMLEAVGILRDARARPVLHAAFEAKGQSPAVLLAAGRALGKLGGDAELGLLKKHAVKGDPLLLAAIAGLGEMRRKESAQHLASLLSANVQTDAVAEAMGQLGSSWAWRTLGPKAAATGLEVRKICAQALAPSYRKNPKSRTALGEALLMVDHPSTVALLESEKASAGKHAAALDAMITRVERQRARSKH